MSSPTPRSSAPKIIPSSLAAACDNVERPNESRMGSIENVEAFILANAPLKFRTTSALISSSSTNNNQVSEDAAATADAIAADAETTKEDRSNTKDTTTTQESDTSADAQQEKTANENNNENDNNSSSVAFQEAAQLEKLIQMLIYRDGEGRTALHWAVALKNFELAKSLLQIAAKVQQELRQVVPPAPTPQISQPTTENGETVVAATSSSSSSSSSFFVAPWALPPDGNCTTVLATACAVSAPIEFISELIFLATGIESSTTNTSSSSTTSKAVQNSQQLLGQQHQQQQHPFISLPDSQGNTALHLAASRGNIKLVSFLINNFNADLREQNKKGQTTLHRIVARGDTTAVEEILVMARKRFPTEVKKFVNCADKNGDTALHYASMEENREIGEFLLRNGADRNIKNKNGKEFYQV